jgi:hypothetical protein
MLYLLQAALIFLAIVAFGIGVAVVVVPKR